MQPQSCLFSCSSFSCRFVLLIAEQTLATSFPVAVIAALLLAANFVVARRRFQRGCEAET
jgi:hypothetical protein